MNNAVLAGSLLVLSIFLVFVSYNLNPLYNSTTNGTENNVSLQNTSKLPDTFTINFYNDCTSSGGPKIYSASLSYKDSELVWGYNSGLCEANTKEMRFVGKNNITCTWPLSYLSKEELQKHIDSGEFISKPENIESCPHCGTCYKLTDYVPESNKTIIPPEKRLENYGYYSVESIWDNITDIEEVSNYTNIFSFSPPNPYVNSYLLSVSETDRIKKSGLKIGIITLYGDKDMTSNENVWYYYLSGLKDNLTRTGLIDSVAYIQIWDEPYTHVEQGLYNNWTIFKDNSGNLLPLDKRIAIMKSRLEIMTNFVNLLFPRMSVVIFENQDVTIFDKGTNGSFRYTLPSNIDAVGIDPHFLPTSEDCDASQREKFESVMNKALEWANSQGKPIYLAAQSFNYTNTRNTMPSVCQMQWYYNIAKNPNNNITTLMWFAYHGAYNFNGVAYPINYTNRIDYQKQIGKEILGK